MTSTTTSAAEATAEPLPEGFRWIQVEAANGLTFDALTAGPDMGTPVLLLHGFPEFADAWIDVMKPIAAAGYRCVSLQQRGYSDGARPAKVEDYRLEHLVADVLAVADALGIKRFHLVAHDWGGSVAWLLGVNHAERLLTLNVLSTPHLNALSDAIKRSSKQRLMSAYILLFRFPWHLAEALLLRRNGKMLRAGFCGKLPKEREENYVQRLSKPGVLTSALNWYRAFRLTTRIGPIRDVPTLYIWSSADQALGEAAAHGTGSYIQAPYQFEALPGVSHWLLEEAPERCAALCLQSFSRIDDKDKGAESL